MCDDEMDAKTCEEGIENRRKFPDNVAVNFPCTLMSSFLLLKKLLIVSMTCLRETSAHLGYIHVTRLHRIKSRPLDTETRI